ncbi:MAG: tetratricopeptide repeat protein, partial [Anaerolineae bacterium]|nr:tetratricopeptide repeat protein [Anaerolineae bacterium]
AALAVYQDGVDALPDNAELHFRLGQALRRTGDAEAATTEIEQAVALTPNYWQARLNLGSLYEDANLLVQALDQYSQTVQLAPDSADAQFRFAQALRKSGQSQEAIAAFADLLEMPGGDAFPGAYLQMGLAYEALGQDDAAERRYLRAIELDPQSATAMYYLGDLYRRQGKLDDAISNFEQALAIDPSLAEASLQLSAAYRDSGDAERAQEIINQLTNDAAASPAVVAQAHIQLGVMALEASDTATALAQFRAAKKADPTVVGSYFQLAQILLQQGKPADALKQYTAAVEANPASAEAHFELGKALLRNSDDPRSAIDELEKAVEINPGYVEAYLQLSQALVLAGQENRAEVLLNRALKLAQRPELAARVLVQRGELLRQAGETGAAVSDFEAAIDKDPRNLAGYIGLGETFRDRDDLEQAISQYKRALLLDENYADAHVKLGNAYRDAGQYDDAVASLQTAVELQPDNAWYQLLLGDALLAADQPADALAAYQQAGEIEPAYNQDPSYFIRLAGAYRASDDVEQAMEAAKEAERLAVATGDTGEGALLVQAELQRSQELWQAAIDLYQTVLELNPERSQAVRGLALALEGQERNQEAVVQWRAYLKLAPRGEYIDEAREHLRRLVNSTG